MLFNQELIHAVGRRDAKKVKFLLSHGANPNVSISILEANIKRLISLYCHNENSNFSIEQHIRLRTTFTPLINSRIKKFKETLAEENLSNIIPKSLINFAVHNGYIEIVRLLLQYGADLNSSKNRKDTILCKAISNRNIEIVELLLACGTDPNSPGYRSLLFDAVKRKDTTIVRLLLKYGADPNSSEDQILRHAVNSKNTEIVELLLQHDADFSHYSIDSENTILHQVVRNQNIKMARLFLQYGANPNGSLDVINRHDTPLLTAVKKRNIEMIKLLLEYGADPNYHRNFAIDQDIYGDVKELYRNYSPAYNAYRNNDIEILGLLVQHGALMLTEHIEKQVYIEGNEDHYISPLRFFYKMMKRPRNNYLLLDTSSSSSFYQENMDLIFLCSFHNPYEFHYDSCTKVLEKIRNNMPNLYRLIYANRTIKSVDFPGSYGYSEKSFTEASSKYRNAISEYINTISEYTNNENQWKKLIKELEIIKNSSPSYVYKSLKSFIEYIITNYYENKHSKNIICQKNKTDTFCCFLTQDSKNIIFAKNDENFFHRFLKQNSKDIAHIKKNNINFLCYFLIEKSAVKLNFDVVYEIDKYLYDNDRKNISLAHHQDVIDRVYNKENNINFLSYFLIQKSAVKLNFNVVYEIDKYLNDNDRKNILLAYRRDIIERVQNKEDNINFLSYFLIQKSTITHNSNVIYKIDQYLNVNDSNKKNVFLEYRQSIIDRSIYNNQSQEVMTEQDRNKLENLLKDLSLQKNKSSIFDQYHLLGSLAFIISIIVVTPIIAFNTNNKLIYTLALLPVAITLFTLTISKCCSTSITEISIERISRNTQQVQ